MKKFLALLLLAGFSLCAEENIALPAPARSGGMTLAEALNQRKTVRTYKAAELSPLRLSNLLWAANGVNRADGKRTAPSARNRQEITLWLLNKEGAWLYAPDKNMLVRKSEKDLRKAAGKFEAPLYLVLAADLTKCGTGERAIGFARVDAGYVSQNIYLQCAADGLGTCAIGSIPAPEMLKKELGIGKDFLLILTHSVGVPK